MKTAMIGAALASLAACAPTVVVPSSAGPAPTEVADGAEAALAAGAAAAVVDAFHAALGRGDTDAALALLAGDALIFESGGVERSREEYAGHHLGADAAFSQAVPGQVTARTARAAGELAWVASERRVAGTFRGKAIDRRMTETMVLRRDGSGWRIIHIHWSSGAK